MASLRPVVLIILDGFGINPRKEGNAIAHARMPNMDALRDRYPVSSLSVSGTDVGLPDGQMGNSEVGHMILGAGRIVYQDLTLIHKSIDEGTFYENPVLRAGMRETRTASGRLHLMGLLGDGGVHSHQRHLEALIEMSRRERVARVFLHLFLDGRDTPPHSAEQFLLDLEEKLKAYPHASIATLTGRYYAMDRDKRWERTEKAYLCLTEGVGNRAASALEGVRQSYRANVSDEFVLPTVIEAAVPECLIRGGDGVVFFNFRADRARQLTRAFTEENFDGFTRKRRPKLSAYVTMTQYDETFRLPVAFPPRDLKEIVGEIASRHGIPQLRIAETEKYAHVTYFFNGGQEEKFPGEERILIPSPKDVPTYDLKPEMSAPQITETLVRMLHERRFGLVIGNYANADMVGHSGNFAAAVRACETIDACVGKVVEAALAEKGHVLITADHGNIEQMIDYDTGKAHTAHTTNPVPFFLIDEGRTRAALRTGTASDVAPTILELLGIDRPEIMTGRSLIVHS